MINSTPRRTPSLEPIMAVSFNLGNVLGRGCEHRGWKDPCGSTVGHEGRQGRRHSDARRGLDFRHRPNQER